MMSLIAGRSAGTIRAVANKALSELDAVRAVPKVTPSEAVDVFNWLQRHRQGYKSNVSPAVGRRYREVLRAAGIRLAP